MPADGDRVNFTVGLDRPTAAGGHRPRRLGRALGRRRLRQDVRADRAVLGRIGAGRRRRAAPRLGQLVAITFTERAAREMRDRIRTACHRPLAGMSRASGGLLAGAGPRLGLGADQHDPLLLRLAAARPRRRGGHRPAVPRARRRPGRHAAVRVDRRRAARPAGRARRGGAGAGDAVRPGSAARHDRPAAGRAAGDRLAGVARRDARRPGGAVGRVLAPRHRAASLASDQRVGRGPNACSIMAMRYPPAHPKMRERCDFLLRSSFPSSRRAQQPAGRPGGDPRGGQGAGRRNEEGLGQRGGLSSGSATPPRSCATRSTRSKSRCNSTRPRPGPPPKSPCKCSAWPPRWPSNTTGRNESWACWISTTC